MRLRIGRKKTFPNLKQFIQAGEKLDGIIAELDAAIDKANEPEELRLIARLAEQANSAAVNRRIRAEHAVNRLILGMGE